MTADEVIIVDVPDYVKKFTSHIRGVPHRVQANYLLWRAAAASMKYLNEEARKISLSFSQKLTGKIEETGLIFGEILNHTYRTAWRF